MAGYKFYPISSGKIDQDDDVGDDDDDGMDVRDGMKRELARRRKKKKKKNVWQPRLNNRN